MAVQDWFTDPALNVSIDGVNIGEGCPPANVNDMGRRIMAATRVMYDNLPVVTGKVNASAGVFSGTQPIYTGRGAYLHANDSANASGRVYYLVDGSPNPASPANGDVVFFYAP
jgi:hypothetical protein